MNENERDFKGIWISKELWFDKRLKATDRIILAEVDSLDKDGKGCYASNEYLADFCGCNKTHVSKVISKLIELGYIELAKFDGRQRILKSRLVKMTRQTCQNDKADLSKRQGSIYIENNRENSLDNNKKEKKEKSKPKNAKTNFEIIVEDYTTNEELQSAIFEFIKMRKAIKSPMTDRALKQILNKLDTLASSDSEKVRVLDQSIMNSWRGVFPLREEKQKPKDGLKSDDELTEIERQLAEIYK